MDDTANAQASDADVPLSRAALLGLLLSVALVPLGSTMIAVALPAIGDELSIDAAALTQWLVNSYLVVGIVLQSPAGKLGDRWGARRALTSGHVLFAAGAALGFVARSLGLLIAARVAMAAGGALMVPASMALLRNTTPPDRRGRVFGAFGAAMGLSAALGPLVGGLLVELFSWRSIFLSNLPLLLVAAPLVRATARRGPLPTSEARFDWAGTALIGSGLACGVLGSKTSGWAEGGLLGAGALLLVAFAWWERRASDPVLDPALFRLRSFAAGAAIVALHNLSMYAVLFQLPLWFSMVHQSGSEDVGRALLAMMLSMVVCAPLGGRAAERFGARALALAGTLTGLAGIVLLSDLAPKTEPRDAIPALLLMGAGLGLCTAPSQATALSSVDRKQAGMASGALSTSRYLGAVIGISILGVLLGGLSHASDPEEALAAHRAAILVFAACMALALVPSSMLPSKKHRG